MARPRLPLLYGVFQFCCRLVLVVIEVCALASLITLSRYGESLPIGYVAVLFGILFSMAEMVTLANSTHQIPRFRTGILVILDLVLCALGMVSFFYFMISCRWRPEQGAGWPRHDPYRDEKTVWAPWYAWLQLAAALLHFVYMMMHCVDACRQSSRDRRRHERRRHTHRVQWGY
ncbi:hypothetical protein SODALDRAFT_318957 [Sodiomyces alkalinus F11]|uniref:MARVEL domain-containing protein n=1 Tax=Sodiomyces alkalinus (strain CBS 110278 / VKM F-3762 / F11) TaxID=1314773 RepID=A0A3N2Q6E0_SODAK|nr:hypothetical protein SODALDRAFT_318957 [Sodiomyces alkalinus F11]ROT42228.1 hypothetical protein SODALDRAFT_318957 [Sodiomyces alkalinus F11]